VVSCRLGSASQFINRWRGLTLVADGIEILLHLFPGDITPDADAVKCARLVRPGMACALHLSKQGFNLRSYFFLSLPGELFEFLKCALQPPNHVDWPPSHVAVSVYHGRYWGQSWGIPFRRHSEPAGRHGCRSARSAPRLQGQPSGGLRRRKGRGMGRGDFYATGEQTCGCMDSEHATLWMDKLDCRICGTLVGNRSERQPC